jgi:Spy/CpxP family protein refolding chaperone
LSIPEPVSTPAAPQRSKSMWRAALVLFLAFAGGAALGVVGDRFYLLTHERIVPRGGIEFLGRHWQRRLDRSLDLTPDQEVKVKAIIDRRTEGMLRSLNEVHSKMQQEFSETHAEIEQVLTPQQREKFRRMHQRWHGAKRAPQTSLP